MYYISNNVVTIGFVSMHFTHALQTGEYVSYAHSSAGRGQAGDLSKRLEKIQKEYDKQPSGSSLKSDYQEGQIVGMWGENYI